MSGTEILLTIIAVFALFVVAMVVFEVLKKRGIDPQVYLDKAKEIVDTVTTAYELTKPFIGSDINTELFDTIIKVSNVGIENVQQLCDTGKLPPEKRKDEARKYILDTLTLLGVESTPEVIAVVDGAIGSGVYKLPHREISQSTE